MQHTEPMLREGALKNHTIIVTGGGTGLGRSMSHYFATLGANVVITSRKLDVLTQAAEELTAETGGQILPLQCDVRDYDAVNQVIAETVARFGKVTGLVNNAAGNFISPTERLSHRAFDTIVDIVLRGTYNFSLAFGKHCIAQQQPGTMLNIIVAWAWTGSAYTVPSATAKSGVLGLTRSLATEWGKYKIRCNAIAPGPFPTKGAWDRLFPTEALPPEFVEKAKPENAIPLQRYGEHQELANLAAYMMSDYAGYLTGEVITLDGGEWLQNASSMNHLRMIPNEMWDAIEQVIRKNTKG
ncbi:SDR family oxidoreductase [Eisenibacter elegans]|uniref:SDR family oxidoreductase n=1 Tax=Eisenibacter elegans TaxID=997 RepID=UPI0004101CBB|nr:SDR family oxidoreductase [Eisenibacter elegans]